jgi:hypothetical protein
MIDMQNRMWNKLTVVLLGFLVTVIPSCDLNDLDEIQNSSNQAVVRAQFFASRTNQVPVAGVRMVVEADEDSDQPYRGPDVIGVSGEDGVATVRVFPGFEDEDEQNNNNSGGDQQPMGPENPLDLPPPVFFGDAAVTLIYQGSIVSFISGGLTLGSGRLFDLGPIFLDELGFTVN